MGENAPGPADAAVVDASSEASVEASAPREAGCMISDHAPRTGDNCTSATGNFGPAMAVDATGLHCIDKTEVTYSQYQIFLGERGANNTCGQPADCSWNVSYMPTTTDQVGSAPVVNIDWCDAFMYCRWAGKQLCGSAGDANTPSGNVAPADTRNGGVDLWYSFCTGPLPTDYFYGPTPTPGTCQDAMRAAETDSGGGVQKVGSAPACHGDGASLEVYDMIGNAAEWEWSCVGSGRSAQCLIRGGSWIQGDRDELTCSTTPAVPRETVSDTIGFRCCVE